MATKSNTAKTTTPAADEGEWSSEPAFFERAIDEKRTIKACVATSPDGTKFVSIREWRVRKDGTPYYTRNNVLVPMSEAGTREVWVAALQADHAKAPAAPAKATKAKAKK